MRQPRRTGSETRAADLRHTLEAAIFAGTLRPGTRLDEVELAERFGVSRTPVREALQSLAASGLVDIRARQGAHVASVSLPMLLEMFQVMAELEGLCANLAARRARPEQHRKLEETHRHLVDVDKENDPVKFYEANRQFHEALYEASNSEFIAEQTLLLRNRVSPYRRYITFQPGRMIATIEEHEAVLAAVLAADPVVAQRAMRDHVNLLGDNLTDFIASIPPEALTPPGERSTAARRNARILEAADGAP